MTVAPPARVIAAFGARGGASALGGGRGSAWRVGDLVFKPIDRAIPELEWAAELFESITADGFRLARPRRAQDGALVVAGWCVSEYLDGTHEAGRWQSIIAAGERFHGAISSVPRPDFLDVRTDPWAVGDRVAWGELPIADYLHIKHVDALANALQPVTAPAQVVHGDLTGNVLFSPGLPPAIIDFSPYWRPPPFASAIVVGDALIWEGADANLLAAVSRIDDFEQFLLRALIYRVVTDGLFRRDEPDRSDADDPFLPAVALALAAVWNAAEDP